LRNNYIIYQEIAEPLHKDSVSETITVDKWYKDHPKPVLKKALSTAILAGSFFMHPTTSFAEDIKLDKWFQPTQQPVLRKVTRQTGGESRFEVPRTILLSDWLNSYPLQLKQPLRKLPSGDTRTEVVSSVEDVTVDKWFRLIEQPYFSKKRFYYTGESRFDIPRDMLISDWLSQYPNQLKQKIRKTDFGEYRFEVPRDILVSDWFRPTEQPRIIKLRNVNTGDTRTELEIVSAEIITLDKWWQITQQPTLRKVTRQPGGEFRFEVPRTILLSDWWQAASQPRIVKLRDSNFGNILVDFSLPGVETITLDKWFRQLNEPTRRKVTRQTAGEFRFEIPSLTFDWIQQQPQPVRKLITRVYTQDYSVRGITVQELVTLDKWFKETNQPRIVKFRDSRFGQYFVEVPRNILITDWWQTTQEPVIRKRHSLPVEYMVGNFLVALPIIESEIALFHSRITTNVNDQSEITDANLSSGITNVNTGSDIQPDELRLSSRIINRNAL